MSWALELDPRDAAALGPLRLEPGVEVCLDRDALWVRGADRQGVERALACVPARRRYRLDDGRLVPLGARLATGALPPQGWRRLADWLEPVLGALGLPAERPAPITLRVVPDATGAPVAADLLITTAPSWRAWAATASALRLAPLRFAASADARILVEGAPLPPLPGVRWRVAEGVAVPCGMRWEPPVDAATVAVALGLLPGDLGLLHPDGSCERLDAGVFVPATRAAALASTGGRLDA